MTVLLISETVSWFLANPEIGWIVAVIYIAFEVRSRWGKVNELLGVLKNVITVVRALARVHDDVDTRSVDEYLVENGMEPEDFISSKAEQQTVKDRHEGD